MRDKDNDDELQRLINSDDALTNQDTEQRLREFLAKIPAITGNIPPAITIGRDADEAAIAAALKNSDHITIFVIKEPRRGE